MRLRITHDKVKVRVIVKNGWVTLTGTLDWQWQKDAAARSLRNLMGVIGVTNSITIKPEAKWIAVKSKIEDLFRRNTDSPARCAPAHGMG